jgi:hypothetical protein
MKRILSVLILLVMCAGFAQADYNTVWPLARGGTGQTTQQAALDAVAGSVVSGMYARGDGTHVTMSAIQSGDVPTLNQNTTGSAGSVAAGNITGATLSSTVTASSLKSFGTGIALGTPASGNATNLTGTASALTSGLVTNGVYTTDTGTVTNIMLLNNSTTVNGQSCTLGSTCSITAAASAITSGSTLVSGGTSTNLLYINSGTLGDEPASGLSVASANTLVTPRAIGGVNFDGSAAITPQQIQPASESSDTTNFLAFFNAASGTPQQLKYNVSLGYNASTSALTATTFIGALTGNASTATTAATLTGALSANQLLGSLTSVAPTGQTVPSCSTSGSALLWTSGTGFSCNAAIAASTATSATTAGTLTTAITANSVLGSLTAVAPTAQAVPSCSTSGSALKWTSGTGFGCNTAVAASTVTTNANLTGVITSSGNATSIASQTGTGTTFVTSASPTITGNLKAPALISSGTKFTASGCSNSTTVGGSTAGTFASGTTGVCTVIITMAGATGITAPTGWACFANDMTTTADKINQTASSVTTATISGTTASGDVISFGCIGY